MGTQLVLPGAGHVSRVASSLRVANAVILILSWTPKI